jgi:hypothetical protein
MKTVKRTRSKRGDGSLRERRPDVWEIRVTTGFDLSNGRSIQTSLIVGLVIESGWLAASRGGCGGRFVV